MATRKKCCICGTDVTDLPRFRDDQGNYWCAECTAQDKRARKGVTCPACGRKFMPQEMVRSGGKYLCQACDLVQSSAANAGEARTITARNPRLVPLLSVFLVLLLVFVYVIYSTYYS
jgi:DNA-directed RNA polymerase subunit RPC12/RpoP